MTIEFGSNLLNMQLGTVIAARNALMEMKDNCVIPVRLGYKIVTFLRKTTGDAEFYSKEKASIVEQWGERDDDGTLIRDENGGFKVSAENWISASVKLQELDEVAAEDPGVRFTLDELELVPTGMRLEILDALYPFIETDLDCKAYVCPPDLG